jgi:disulfide bond formation protein DsbB
LYPLAIILGIACFRSDNRIAIYTLPLSVLGALFAIYQYLEQMIPGFAPIDVCGAGPSCRHIDWILGGFITLPLISAAGFLALTLLLTLVYFIAHFESK